MPWLLLIHEHPVLGELVKTMLEPVIRNEGGEVVFATTMTEARLAMGEHGRANCRLIVSSASVPLVVGQPPPLDRSRPTLTSFLHDMRSADAQPPCIALLPLDEGDRGEQFDEIRNVEMVGVGSLLQLPALAAKLMSAEEGERVCLPHDVDVDIQLSDQGGHWSMRGAGHNPIEVSGWITIEAEERNRLLTDSRAAAKAEPGAISQLGRDMYTHFMAHPQKSGLELALARYTRPANTLDTVRFRFHVDEKNNQMLVETLAKPRSQQQGGDAEFWMLKNPIFRKFGASGVRHPLFKDWNSRHKAVECLIIQGNADRFTAGGKLAQEFPRIPGAAEETNWLEKYLVKNQKLFKLGVPKVMRPGDDRGVDYGASVREALSSRNWQLIHYVGHSAIGTDGKGYLALSDGCNDLIDIDDFAARAKHAQFVFLNSCMSANSAFIMKLIEKDIPAVAGYAWTIEDHYAGAFSRSFYENLFAGAVSQKFLEYSFMRARAHLHDTFREKPVWTSPQLFMQLSQSEPERSKAGH